jgi:drug/metabolite transporter (DMT)-like permease
VGGGLLWPGTLYILTWGIRHFGVALVGSVARLALVVPVLFAWFFLRELLTWQSATGDAAAFVALYCLSPLQRGHLQAVNRQTLWYFPLLVLAMGTVELWANLFHTFGQADENFLFLTFIFTFAMIFSWLAIWRRRQPLDKAAVRRGFVLGVPNFFATFFLLESLRSPLFSDHSAVVYSVYSVAGVVLIFAAGALVWREPVTYRSALGVLVAVGAIILLNNF